MKATQVNNSKYMAKDFFTYQIGPLGPAAASVQLPGNVTLDADADFLWQKFTAYAAIGGASQTLADGVIPSFTITITDTASGRSLMNSPVPLAALAGNGGLPFILPTPKIFQSRGTINVQVQNIGNSTYSALYLLFIGTKLFLK